MPQRVGDACLVHRRQRARRCVRRQQRDLGLGQLALALDDHRDRGRAAGTPAGKALEAIDDLELVAVADDADRELRQLASQRRRPPSPLPQCLQARAQALDRDLAHAWRTAFC